METATSMPLSQRINLRMIVFLAVIAMPFIYFGAVFIKASTSQGITQKNGYLAVDLKAMGNFALDPATGTIDSVPPRYRQLDGKKVQLTGFMWAGKSASPRVSQFEFVYNVAKCCFNGPPLVQERVYAAAPEGKSMPYVSDYIELTGTLHVKVVRDDAGNIVSVYTLDVEDAKPAS